MSENYPKDDRQAHAEPGVTRRKPSMLLIVLVLAVLALASAIAFATLTGGPKQDATTDASQQAEPLEAVDTPAPPKNTTLLLSFNISVNCSI